MSDPSIIDLRDLQPSGGTRQPSRTSLRILEYAGAIVEAMSACWQGPIARLTAAACRRRPGRRPCGGHVEVLGIDEHVDWRCARCGDAGTILNWRGGRHDLSRIDVDGMYGGRWRAALLPADEYAALGRPRWAFVPALHRVLRAARPTRPGIRIEAPEAVWPDLIMETAQRALDRPRNHGRRLLRSAWLRFVDASQDW